MSLHHGAELIRPDLPDPIYDLKMADPRFVYFSGAQGAIDGTHILLRVPKDDQARFRDRHSLYSMNCLFAVNFSMLVNFVLVGAEGATSDPDPAAAF